MSAYVALPEPESDGQGELLLGRTRAEGDRADADRSDVGAAAPRHRPDLRLRVGAMSSARSLAASTMVVGITVLVSACVAIPVPKLSPLPSLIAVAVFAALLMMAVAVAVLIRDDRLESWAPNLLFLVLCAVFFTVAAGFVALLYGSEERLAPAWRTQSQEGAGPPPPHARGRVGGRTEPPVPGPELRRRLVQQLNRRRSSSALDEEQAGLVIVAESAMTSLHLGVLCLILLGVEVGGRPLPTYLPSGRRSLIDILGPRPAAQVAISFPLCLLQQVGGDSGRGASGFESVTRGLQEAGLL